jgi:hypothetical protein
MATAAVSAPQKRNGRAAVGPRKSIAAGTAGLIARGRPGRVSHARESSGIADVAAEGSGMLAAECALPSRPCV